MPRHRTLCAPRMHQQQMHWCAVWWGGQVLYDEGGRVWVMLHSGSRNVGNITAQYYDKVASEHLQALGLDTRALGGLNYLEIDSTDGRAYLQVSFAVCHFLACRVLQLWGWLHG